MKNKSASRLGIIERVFSTIGLYRTNPEKPYLSKKDLMRLAIFLGDTLKEKGSHREEK